jgi:hypothetical protein
MREAGFQKQALSQAQRGAFEGHANQYNAAADKLREEASGLAQRRQYQTPEFANRIAATLNGLSPEVGDMVARGDANHGLTPEQMQRFNQARGAQLLSLGSTKDSDSETTMKVISSLLGRNDYDASKASPAAAVSYAQSQYAQKGGAPFNNMGDSGTFNVLTGAQDINGIGKSVIGKNSAVAAKEYAHAGDYKAGAELKRSKIGQPTINPDGSVTAPAVPPKPMPAAALKMQQEGLENLSIASNINPMMQRFAEDIDSNKLRLGPVANLMNRGKNFAGSSDEGSRNFASFQATLEKLRNDSLRLNKGVQTDGDAQRAWNELMSNINDPGVVKQRIKEIQGINEKAVELHRMQVNQVRRNFGHPDIDVSGYVAPAAKPSGENSGWGIKEVKK